MRFEDVTRLFLEHLGIDMAWFNGIKNWLHLVSSVGQATLIRTLALLNCLGRIETFKIVLNMF